MSLLQKRPPKTVTVDGVEYGINSDFRAMIAFEQLLKSTDINEEARLIRAMLLFYGANMPKNFTTGFNELLTFYKCGELKAAISESNADYVSKEPAYDFYQDDQYIYAAFLDQYGIDLNKVEYLHWWEFRALFLGLKQDCEISRIMGYRTMKIPSKGMSKQEKAFYKKMKAVFKIRENKSGVRMTLQQRNNLMLERVKKCAEEVKAARHNGEHK